MPKAFISYSWDSEVHKDWVRTLATRLRGDGIETILDQWHVVPGDQLPAFMERAVRESDYVLIVCTPRYKQRSEARAGGVGYEGDIITGEVFTTGNERKFIPVLRASPCLSSAPSWLAGKYYVDLGEEPYPEHHYNDLLTTMLGIRPEAPPIGRVVQPASGLSAGTGTAARPRGADSTSPLSPEPIRITGVVVDKIGVPRNDGTRGSGLYRVPFRLSRRPPAEWSRFFVEAWDHPPSYGPMHRRGIASVDGDTVVLNGTTVEEVERHHRPTLVLAVQEANRRFQEFGTRQREQEQRRRERVEAHNENVADVARRIKFE